MGITNFLDCQNMLSKDQIKGKIPDNKSIFTRAFNVAWPSATESILVALIGAVDTMMVGQLGSKAIAAVGICNQPKFVLMATILGLNTGVNVVTARRKGEGRQDEANRTLRNALIISTILSLLFSLFGFFNAEWFLRLAGANNDYIHLAIEYFRIIMIGNFFFCMSLTMTAAQRGVGNTKISMTCNLTANLVNVVLNFCLISGHFGFPALGVRGAAIATMVGNIVAFSMALYSVLKKNNYLHISPRQDWRLNKYTCKAIYKVTLPSFIEQIFLRIGFFTYSRAVANLGTTALATHQVCMNVMTISFGMGDGLSVASSTLVGQSLGEVRSDLAIIYGKVLQRIGFIMSACMGALILVFRHQIIQLFSSEPEVIEQGSFILIMLSFIILFQVSQVITTGALRGAGDAKFVAFISLITVTFIRPGATYLLAYGFHMGLVGAWLSIFIDQMFRLIFGKYRFNNAEWAKIKL